MGILLLRPQQVVIGDTKEFLRTKSPTTTDDPHRALMDKGIVDSGCSKHMTGNKAHLADYQEFKGGSVAFGGSNRRITAKPTESKGFKQIIDFLNGSSVSYAFTASPTIRTSCIKQFWTTVKVNTINDEVRIQALIDEKRCLSAKTTSWNEFSSTMASTIIYLATNQKFNFSRYILLSLVKNIEADILFFMFPRFVQLLIDHQLDDMSHHKDIYDNPFLTKKVFSNMKRVGTGLSGVVTSLFDNMLVLAAKEVGLIQDDVQSISILTEPSTSKSYKKHKPKIQQTQAPKVPSPEPSPKHRLPSHSNDPLPHGKDSLKLKELMNLCTHLSNKVLELESEVIDIKSTYKERIEKLEGRVDMLVDENRVLKELHSVHSKVDTTAPVVEKEKSFKQGRIIIDIDEDVEINLEEAQAKTYRMYLEHSENVLSMQDVNDEEPVEVEEVLKVVTAAKLIIEVVTTAGATTTAEATKVSVPRRRKGVVIQDPEETTSKIEQDKSFTRQLEAELNADINWNAVIEQVKRSERLNDTVMKYQALNRKPLTEAQARKNMIIYLKNMAGYKMNYFNGMTYSEIRPLFEKHYNYNQAFLEEVNEEVIIPEKEVEVEGHKREGESLKNEITKKQKMDEEAEELKSYLQIVSNDDDDDDVYTEATPLASKIPIVDYKIHLERNIPYFKIIRADEQMLNNVRLEVEEESEMSLELLRLVRRQLNEGYVPE
nr:hypothetical protein [Tanacetum cinerariifolium]